MTAGLSTMEVPTAAPAGLPEAQVADDAPPQSPPAPDAEPVIQETTAPAKKKTAGKKAKTFELTLTVTGSADGEWRAEIKQGSSYLVRNVAVAAAAVSRAAKELHEELFTPIEALMNEARTQQAARVAVLEAELEAARKALADLD